MSEWRQNVYDYAMGKSDWLLCARLDDIAWFPEALLVKRRGSPRWWIYQGVPGQVPAVVFSGLHFGAHFPYGFEVAGGN